MKVREVAFFGSRVEWLLGDLERGECKGLSSQEIKP